MAYLSSNTRIAGNIVYHEGNIEPKIISTLETNDITIGGTLTVDGNISAIGQISWSGGNSDNANRAYQHSLSDGSDHRFINQDVTTSASPSFNKITLTQVTGTSPFIVKSTTKVDNLNADLLDDKDGSYYLSRANHTGTQPASTISGLAKVATTGNYNDLTNTPGLVTNVQNGLMKKEDKVKLDNIEENANNYVHPNDPSIRHVTDEEKNIWNNKANATLVTSTSNGLMSKDDKAKLDGIEKNANNYVHPTNDGNKHIPANGTTNGGKVLKAGHSEGSYSWSNIAFNELTSRPTTLAGYGITDASLNTHKHDSDYLKLTGGTLTGPLTVKNTIKSSSSDGSAVELLLERTQSSNRSWKVTNEGNNLVFSSKLASESSWNSSLKILSGELNQLYVGNNKVYHTGNKPTLTELGAASENHTHKSIVSRGNVTCESGVTRPSESGLSMSEASNNGYPTAYGNIITTKGNGDGQILLGWSNTSDEPGGIYVRSKRNAADANWSQWTQLYSTFNKPSAQDIGAAPAEHTHNVATTTTNGFMSKDDKIKLNGIATNANNYVHPTSDGNLHLPVIGTNNNGKVLVAGSSAGSSSWKKLTAGDVDTYTKGEIDGLFNTFTTGMDWKESVNTFDDIFTTYPNPVDGWTVNVKDTDVTYRFNGSTWIAISANAIPLASEEVDGKMSKEDKVKLNGIQKGAEVNQNAFSNIKINSSILTSKNKIDTLELVPGNNIALTTNTSNNSITIGVSGIANGAEVNQNAFSNINVNGTTINATGKTDTFNLISGKNVSMTTNGKNITINSSYTNNYIKGISGSGNGLVTIQREGLSNITWDSTHNHNDSYYTKTETDNKYYNKTGGTISGNVTITGTTSMNNNVTINGKATVNEVEASSNVSAKKVKASEEINIKDKVSMVWNDVTNTLDFVFA